MTMETQILCPNSPSSPSSPPLAMHKNSQTISKSKPKIRIIHIFAPEIIQTDAANFRELVQRLTGKPTEADSDTVAKPKARVSRKKEARNLSSREMGGFRERVKEEEEEIWRGANSGGGFLGEFDGFMHELNHLPFLEGTNPMQDVYGEC